MKVYVVSRSFPAKDYSKRKRGHLSKSKLITNGTALTNLSYSGDPFTEGTYNIRRPEGLVAMQWLHEYGKASNVLQILQ